MTPPIALLAGGASEDEFTEVIGEGITAEDWIVAGLVVVGSIVLAVFLRRLVVRLISRTDAEESVARFVGTFLRNVIILVGFTLALVMLEVRITPLLGALGIGGLAIAFAAQSILENTFASILLRTRRPFRRGDQISTGDLAGTVEDVNFRTVVLRTYDGERVLVPCSNVLTSAIINHTVNGRRRTTLDVGVHYDTSLPDAQQILLTAAGSVDGVLSSPSPEAYVHEFGDSSINFALRYWHAPDIATLWRVRSEVAMAVKAGFDEAGIEIPFPQRVLTFATSIPDEA